MDQSLAKAWEALPGVPLPPGGDFKDIKGTEIPRTPAPRVTRAPVSESAAGIVGGAVADTLALSGRPGSDPLGRAVFQPKNVPEAAIREAIMAPMAAVSLPARLLTSAGSGGVASLGSGHSLGEAGWATLLDAAVAGGSEALMGGAARLATRGARKAGHLAASFLEGTATAKRSEAAYQRTFTALEEMFQAVKARLPRTADVYAPTLSTTPLTPQQALNALKDPKLEGHTYELALKEVAKEFDRLDTMASMVSRRATPTTPAAQQFIPTPGASLAGARLEAAAPRRFAPRPPPTGTYAERVAAGESERAGRRAERLRDPRWRAVVDAAATTPTDEGEQPVGATAAIMAGKGLGEAVSAGGHALPYYLLRHAP